MYDIDTYHPQQHYIKYIYMYGIKTPQSLIKFNHLIVYEFKLV